MKYYIAIDRKARAKIDTQSLGTYGLSIKQNLKHPLWYKRLRNELICKTFKVPEIFRMSNQELISFEGSNHFIYRVSPLLFWRLFMTRSKILKNFFKDAKLIVLSFGKYKKISNKFHQK